MGVITGGTVLPPAAAGANPGLKQRVYKAEAVPTDTNIGVTPVNGMLAENVVTGFVYERQAGVWVRIDTI